MASLVFKSLVFVTLSKDVQVTKEARQRGREASALDSQCGGPGFSSRSDHQLVYCQLSRVKILGYACK